MATGTLLPNIFPQWVDANGNPYAGGKLYSYLAGTSTPTPVYKDSALTTAHTNPVILDSAGRPPDGTIFVSSIAYKFILHTSADVLVATVDNVTPFGFSPAVGEQWFSFAGEETANVTATTYAGTDTIHQGTAILSLNSANLPPGVYKLNGVLFSASGASTISAALVNLTDAPDTAIIEIGTSSTGPALVTSGAITFAVAGSTKEYGIRCKVSAGTGHACGFYLTRHAS